MCHQQWSGTSSANKRCSIPSNHRRPLSPFYASVGCPCQVHISLFPKMVKLLARAKDALPQPTFSFLSSQLAYVQGLDLATSAFTFALTGVTYTYNFCLNQLSQLFFPPRCVQDTLISIFLLLHFLLWAPSSLGNFKQSTFYSKLIFKQERAKKG